MHRPKKRPAPAAVPAPEPVPERKRRGRPHTKTLEAFLTHLAAKGSVTYAANRSGIDRRVLYRLKTADEAFGARWDEALQLGVERLQDDAMRRALEGTAQPVWRGGKQVGSVKQFDNRLLQFLLKAHRPETYGDRSRAGAPPLPFDLARRIASVRGLPRPRASRRWVARARWSKRTYIGRAAPRSALAPTRMQSCR